MCHARGMAAMAPQTMAHSDPRTGKPLAFIDLKAEVRVISGGWLGAPAESAHLSAYLVRASMPN